MKKIKYLFLFLVVSLAMTPSLVLAADGGGNEDPPVLIECFNGCEKSIMGILEKIITWMYSIFFVLAVGFILWAAFLYLTAGEDKGKVDEAKKRLTNAAIAIVVALVASGVAGIIKSFIDTSVS